MYSITSLYPVLSYLKLDEEKNLAFFPLDLKLGVSLVFFY